MAGNRVICTTKHVDYIAIRAAMCQGARTLPEVAAITGVCGVCESCKAELDGIFSSVCGCKNVSLAAVVSAVKDGATTVEQVGEITGAGIDCGRCNKLIANIIKLGK